MRYDLRPDSVGWTVIEAATGRPIALHGMVMVGISLEEADELVDLLNARDLRSATAAAQAAASLRIPAA